MARQVPDVTACLSADVSPDAQAHFFVVCAVHFRQHREALPIAIHTQYHHTACSHAVDAFGRPLDIVREEVPAGQHDEILRAAADIESALLVEVTQVFAVEPTVIAGQPHDTGRGAIILGDAGTAQLDGPDLPVPQDFFSPRDADLDAGYR